MPGWPGVHGPIIACGDVLSTYGRFNNPHNNLIDNMMIFVAFWEELPADSR